MEALKMTKRINYKVVNKSGEVVDDIDFEDYEGLADHMLELADKYYQGIYTVDDQVNISMFDDSGNLIYKDKASFEGEVESVEEINLEDEFRKLVE